MKDGWKERNDELIVMNVLLRGCFFPYAVAILNHL